MKGQKIRAWAVFHVTLSLFLLVLWYSPPPPHFSYCTSSYFHLGLIILPSIAYSACVFLSVSGGVCSLSQAFQPVFLDHWFLPAPWRIGSLVWIPWLVLTLACLTILQAFCSFFLWITSLSCTSSVHPKWKLFILCRCTVRWNLGCLYTERRIHVCFISQCSIIIGGHLTLLFVQNIVWCLQMLSRLS